MRKSSGNIYVEVLKGFLDRLVRELARELKRRSLRTGVACVMSIPSVIRNRKKKGKEGFV